MKPELTKEGRKALWKAVRNIEKMPRTFNMDEWLSHNPEVKKKKGVPEPYCGTVACIAGHLALTALDEAPNGEGHEIKLPEGFPHVRGERVRYNGIDNTAFRSANVEVFANYILGVPTSISGGFNAETDNLFMGFRWKGEKVTSRNIRARVKGWLRTGE